MANRTENLGLNTWLESDIVNFEEVNENFEKLDTMTMIFETGTKSSYYSGGSSTTANWRYKKYSDGMIEMSTKLEFTNLKSDGGMVVPYYSGDVQVYFPFQLEELYDVQMHMSSSTVGWVSDATDRTVLDYLIFKIMSMSKEETTIFKQVFITVKGKLVDNG